MLTLRFFGTLRFCFSEFGFRSLNIQVMWSSHYSVVVVVAVALVLIGENLSLPQGPRGADDIKVWPDFRCLAGWSNDDALNSSGPLPNDTISSLAAFRRLQNKCEEPLRPTEEDQRCTKACILQSLQAIELSNKDGNGNELILVKPQSFMSGLKSILSDKTILKFQNDVYPLLKGSWTDDALDKPCTHKTWDAFFADLDSQIKNISDVDCEARLGLITATPPPTTTTITISTSSTITSSSSIQSDMQEYIDNYVGITAGIDFSCYKDFEYLGADSKDGGGMEDFIQWNEQCNKLLSDAGISNLCFQPCLLEKMGVYFFNFDNGTYAPQLQSKELVSMSFDFLTGPNSTSTAAKLGEKMNELCKHALDSVKMESCTKWQVFEDCIEKALSCKYSGRFLRQNNKELKAPSNKTSIKSMFPDLSCKTGYLITRDVKKGSGLLNSCKRKCVKAIGNNTNSKWFMACVLGQMGILRLKRKQKVGEEYTRANKPILLSKEFIQANMSKILAGRGGMNTSEYIATKIHTTCLDLYDGAFHDGDSLNAEDDWWLELYNCIRKVVDCRGAIFLKPDVILSADESNEQEPP